RQTPSQSASSADRVEVICELILSDVAIAPDEWLPGQRDAITHRGGPLLVLGAAGTGKTRVVLERFKWLVQRRCRPERIALLAPFIRRIDRLKANLIGAEDYAAWAEGLQASATDPAEALLELEFAEVYRSHERMLAEAGVADRGDVIGEALRTLGERPALAE